MKSSKIISILQTDNSVYANSLTRGLLSVNTYNNKKNIVVDIRQNSNIIWSYYGKKSIKYLDDILNIIANVNISMLKSYFDNNNDVICVKDISDLSYDNFKLIINSLHEIYDNIFIVCDTADKGNILLLSDVILCPFEKEPVALSNYKKIYSDIIINKIKNITVFPVVLKTDIDFNIDEQDETFVSDKSIFVNFNSDIEKEVISKNFMFNDNKNEFVAGIKTIINKICNETDNINNADYISETSNNYVLLKEKLHKDLIEKMKEYSDEQDKNVILNIIKVKIQELLSIYGIKISNDTEKKLTKELVDDIAGLGILEDLLADEDITEIMVNGSDNIYVEKKGKIEKTNLKFTDIEKLKTVINRIVAPIGRHIDESSPIVDARLKDGSRVNVVISPISLYGPILTIRKFAKHKLFGTELINYGSLNKEMLDFLKIAVGNKKNILISGGTGSGKTTLLNIISSFIDSKERIITIEDSAELQLQQEHVIRLESRPKSLEGTSEITIRQLVINSLRMRPDRIIVGECRAGETLDMLQAMNTGHSGSMTTVHSNSCSDAISRLVVMSLMAGFDLPEKSIVSMIVSAIDIIVQIKRCSDGSRKISEISLLEKAENDDYKLVPVFVYNEQKNIFIKNI
ncbi:MAG: CpaF family protein [Endomicrobiaceae bacterium]|nr:CpaF family protein [Endomicrobiaceae bacterium]